MADSSSDEVDDVRTLQDALDCWLEVKAAGRGLSSNTERAYRTDIATFAAYATGRDPKVDRGAADTVRVDELTKDLVTRGLAAMQKAGAAPKSRARMHGTLAGLFSYLISQGVLAADPLIEAGLERPKTGTRLPSYIEDDAEFARVLHAAATADPAARNPWPERDLAVASLLAGTGARTGEICGLRYKHLVLVGEEPYVRVLGKGNQQRDCALSPELVDVLKRYLVSRRDRVGRDPRPGDALFLNTRLAPLTTAALDHSIRGWFNRAGVPMPKGAAAHAFRHTAAMQMLALGESVTVVQDFLAHASLSSTQVYTKATGRQVRAAAGALPVGRLLRRMAP